MATSGKELGQQRAFPSSRVEEQVSAKVAYQEGITKRELFAGLALNGYLARGYLHDAEEAARTCVEHADSLLAELAKDGAP